ncbi:hypothetical protein R2308_002969 [Cronobacter turicensis]|nr:hypothetical protein [Cronobacter turicensis]
MTTMSYCLFRNTSEDFSRCLEKVGAARDLREMAEQYIEWFDQLDEEAVRDEEE